MTTSWGLEEIGQNAARNAASREPSGNVNVMAWASKAARIYTQVKGLRARAHSATHFHILHAGLYPGLSRCIIPSDKSDNDLLFL